MLLYFVIYLMISAVLLFFLSERNIKLWSFKMVIVTFLPIIGWFLPSIWTSKALNFDPDYFPSYMDAQVNDITLELKETQQMVDKKKELDVIPIEEALIINDYFTRRKVLIDVLKIDAYQYIDALKTAVLNEDSETSHYAVTAVSEVKREITISLQKLAVEYNNQQDNPDITNAYADVIIAYLNSGFLDERTTHQYQTLYRQLLQSLIENNHATEQTFENKIDMDLTVKDYAVAEETAWQFIAAFPSDEIGYLKLMAISFELRSYNQLAQKIKLLKGTPIILSNHALKIVRYWAEVEKQHEMVTR